MNFWRRLFGTDPNEVIKTLNTRREMKICLRRLACKGYDGFKSPTYDGFIRNKYEKLSEKQIIKKMKSYMTDRHHPSEPHVHIHKDYIEIDRSSHYTNDSLTVYRVSEEHYVYREYYEN